MNEYDQIRRDCLDESIRRRQEVYEKVPEIRAIDERMASLTVQKTRDLLFAVKESGPDYHDLIKDLIRKKQDLLSSHGYPSDYLEPIYRCADCRDTGYIGGDKCHCFRRRLSDIFYDQSNLSEILSTENFDHFRMEYYPDEPREGLNISPRDNIKEILRTCIDFVKHFNDKTPEDSKRNLLIYGSAGTGKTFLSHCIAEAILRQENSVLYLTAHQFFDRLADRTFRREDQDRDIMEDFLSCDLLIIDDLGTELNNSFVNSILFLCINERLLANRATIINTNLSLEMISELYSERVFSRIVDSYVPLHLFGDDIRVKKALSSS